MNPHKKLFTPSIFDARYHFSLSLFLTTKCLYTFLPVEEQISPFSEGVSLVRSNLAGFSLLIPMCWILSQLLQWSFYKLDLGCVTCGVTSVFQDTATAPEDENAEENVPLVKLGQ